VVYSPQAPDSLSVLCCIFIGKRVDNQLHFTIACKYLPLFIKLPYRGNKTGCYRVMQITHGVLVQKEVSKNYSDIPETLKTTVSEKTLLHPALIHMFEFIVVVN
jgi:hypothetical protein